MAPLLGSHAAQIRSRQLFDIRQPHLMMTLVRQKQCETPLPTADVWDGRSAQKQRVQAVS